MEQDGEIVTFEPTCRVVGSGSASDGVRVDTVTLVDAGDPTVTRAGDLELVLARVVGTPVEGDQTLTATSGPTAPPRRRCCPSFGVVPCGWRDTPTRPTEPHGATRAEPCRRRGRAGRPRRRTPRSASAATPDAARRGVGGARPDVAVRRERRAEPLATSARSATAVASAKESSTRSRDRRPAPASALAGRARRAGVFQSTWAVPICCARRDAGSQPHLVQRARAVAGTELAGVGGEVVEGVVVHGAVVVADEAVRRHELGVELAPGCARRRPPARAGGELVDVEVLRLLVGVDVAVEAVALVGELLHQVVVVVAHPVADGDEVDALAALLGDARR